MVQHANTEKHKKAVEADISATLCQKITFTFTPVCSKTMKITDLKQAAFIAEHASTQTINHLTEIWPQLDKNSETLSKLKHHNTKCAMIIKNVLSPCMLEDIIQEVGESAYGIIIDKSTDVSTLKILCVMLRFFSVPKKK